MIDDADMRIDHLSVPRQLFDERTPHAVAPAELFKKVRLVMLIC
jgi:hypothetical protein